MVNKYRCIHCNKIVWYWQKQYLGLTKAHSGCDLKAFISNITKATSLGYMTEKQATDNLINRQEKAYG